MEQINDKLVVSASDLVGFAACSHLTWLDRKVAAGELVKPHRTDAMLDLLRDRGLKHESDYLAALKAEGIEVVSLDDASSGGPATPEERVKRLKKRAADTSVELTRRTEVIYQATFFDDTTSIGWRGHADFVRAVNYEDSQNFEPEDTKLSGHVSVNAVIQLCNYADHVGRVTGKRPLIIRVILGRGAAPQDFEVSRLFAYYGALKKRFLESLETRDEPYPLPVSHCAVCRWSEHCEKRWKSDDHLSRVAFMTSSQVKRLESVGVSTMDLLSRLDNSIKVPTVAPGVLTRLIEQAKLQKSSEDKAVPDYQIVLPAKEGIGLASLPLPDEGDVFYDIEGHPYFGQTGLEYLHGIATVVGGSFQFRGEWAHSPIEEQRVFEQFVDFLMNRWLEYPGMHVYHYAPYETTALKRLMGQYGTREAEIDAMLRGNLFVDLYRVVRQGVRIGVASYSIKKLEPLYMAARQGQIVMASSSVIEYERWLQSGDQKILDDILLYNKEDVESAWLLRNWLEARRVDVVKAQGELPRGPIVAPDDALKVDPELQKLIDQLNQGRPVGVGKKL